MKNNVFSIFFIFSILLSLGTSILPIQQRKFKWQIHSFNDIREINQLIRKGTTLFKIDLYFVSQKECYTKDIRATSDERGCFLLTHDTPVNSVYYDSIYNYLDELLKYSKHFEENEVINDLAFCFKNTPDDICSEDKNNWKGLVSKLYNYVEQVIMQNRLKIQLVYDGVKAECVLDLWPNWIYTWIRKRDPDEAFFSNNKEKHYDKFVIFNDSVQTLAESSALGWGKFITMNRPLQLWEPNNQNDIQYFAKIFADNPHPFGYAFAINIDTSMYQVYSADISKENFNLNIISENTFSMKNSAFIVVGKEYVLLFNSITQKLLLYHIEENSIIKIKELDNTIPKGELKDALYLGFSKEKYYIIVNNKEGDFCLYEFSSSFDILSSKCDSFNDYFYSNEIKKKPQNLNALSLSIASFDIIEEINPQTFNKIKMILSLVDKNMKNEVIIMNLSMSLDLKTKIVNFEDKLVFDDSIDNMSIKCTNNKCILLTKSEKNINIYSHIIIYNSKKIETFVSPWKNFGVGNNFSISLISMNNVDKFLFVKDDGFCYHTEPSNKDAYIRMCEQVEVPKAHVLNYIYGKINPDSDPEDNYSSVCSKEVITGSYDMGNYPKVSLFLDQEGKIDFIEMHDGIKDNTGIDTNCGLSNFYEGIVLDNWNLGDVTL